jgi:hypothetical protein
MAICTQLEVFYPYMGVIGGTGLAHPPRFSSSEAWMKNESIRSLIGRRSNLVCVLAFCSAETLQRLVKGLQQLIGGLNIIRRVGQKK